ncbi:MAG: TVP38/TMEM64 family protein [Candidatus Sericytochromatia bacterium]
MTPHAGRLRLQGLLLILGLSVVLAGTLWGLFQLSQPFWPAAWRTGLQQLETQPISQSLAQLQTWTRALPALPLWFILAQFLQVILAPIPGQLMALLGGWLFGFGAGLSLTMLGLTLGSALAMLLGRWGGRPLLQRLLPRTLLMRFDHLAANSGYLTFFLLFLLPALPDDALCLVAGLTPLRLRWLMLMCLLGRLPGMAILSWAGSHVEAASQPLNQILLVLLAVLGLGLWFWQARLETVFSRWIHRFSPGSDTQQR